MFKREHVCKGFKYPNLSFGAMIPRVSVELMKLDTTIMENISEVDVLNFVPLCESMESLSISHYFNCVWVSCQNQGNVYGDNFITRFKDNVSDMFENGELDKDADMTA